MRVHFIAIGGSAMHNLAIALHRKGYIVSGSDDEINEPSRSRLLQQGLLPQLIGWDELRISTNIDAVILGMHARADNPELIKAKELGLKIFSYPEYIYEQTKDKLRVIVGGSHGKTTITSMILHVLNFHKIPHDFMVGAQLEGYDCMVGLNENTKIAVLEGDEYLSSPIDRRPKFHLYKPHIAIISGIAWDHMNVFPTFENYVDQFRKFINVIEPNGKLIFCEEDDELKKLAAENFLNSPEKIPYSVHLYEIKNETTFLKTKNGKYELQVFGEHNLMNLNGARLVCNSLGIDDEKFYEAISSFKGAARRLELVKKNNSTALFRDFAHSPSKLKATTDAVKKQYPGRKLIACMELHTFSSLNSDFLSQYNGSMALADKAFVYYNPQTIEHKKLKPVSVSDVKTAFNSSNVEVFTDSDILKEKLIKNEKEQTVFLMMSSGTFDGIDMKKLADELIK